MSQHARDAKEVQKFMDRRTDVQRYAVAYGGRGAPALSADGHLRDPSDDPCPPGVEPLTTAFGQYVYFLNLSVRAVGTEEQERLRKRAAEANESDPPLELVWPATEVPPDQQSTQRPSLATQVVGFGCRQWCKLFSGGEKEPDDQNEGTTTAKAPYIGILAQREAREAHLPNNGYAPPFSDEDEEDVQWRYEEDQEPEATAPLYATVIRAGHNQRPGMPKNPEEAAAYVVQLEVLAITVAATTPEQRFIKRYGYRPPLRRDGSLNPLDDPCPPHCEPLDTVLGRQLMYEICHTPNGVARCAQHLVERNNKDQGEVGITPRIHHDFGRKGVRQHMPHRSQGSGNTHRQ